MDDAIAMVKAEVAGGTPTGLEGAKMMMLVNRETGKGLGLTLFESERVMPRRRGPQCDEPGEQRAGPGTGVEFFEVPVQTVI